MFVYAPDDTLHLGRAIPREWLANGKQIYASGVATRFGDVSVEYVSRADNGYITLTADLTLVRQPKHIVARFRHPLDLPIKSVTVNGKPHAKFDAVKGDVDLTGMSGHLIVEARY